MPSPATPSSAAPAASTGSGAPKTFVARRDRCRELFTEADAALSAGERQTAYDLYTAGHDLVLDAADLHRQAHRKLLVVNRLLGHRREAITDRLLLLASPLGVFELVAWHCGRTGAYPETS